MTPSAPSAPDQTSRPASPSGRQVWRSVRAPLLVGLALLLIAVVSVVARERTPVGHLEPEAANDSGSRALATLLEERGVGVEPVSTVAQARAAAAPDRLILLAHSEILSRRQLGALAELPGDRLLIEPSAQALRALAPGVSGTGSAPVRTRNPECALPAAGRAGAATTGGQTYRLRDSSGRGCYPASGGPSLVRVARDGRAVTVAGSGRAFTNDRLDDQGNAALAMNLAGSQSAVVWLVPDPAATGAAQDENPGLLALVPNSVPLAAVQLAIAVLLLACWRARRLGPVVTESLPVTVRAAETVEGRARLYRSRRARAQAARTLRAGCLARLAPRLGFERDADPRAVVESVAARTGWSGASVSAVIYGPVPEDDPALVRLADDLDALETEVTRS